MAVFLPVFDCASTPYRLMCGTPHPDQCELFYVNRDSLFSYHKLSEAFLQRVWSLYVSSHYKNSPDDLQLLSDAPAHQLFVLLGPQKEGVTLPDVLCVIQVCFEGQIEKETVRKELSKGNRSAGDLIPWTVAQQFLDSDFSQLSARASCASPHTPTCKEWDMADGHWSCCSSSSRARSSSAARRKKRRRRRRRWR